jgi:hypothetical protein
VNDRLRLVLLSFLMLFTELALIRWTGSNVVYLSYFSNFVLLGSFLGIGIGFLRGEARFDLSRYGPIGLALLVGFVLAFPVEIDRTGGELIYFGSLIPGGLPIWVTLPVIFVTVALVMMMIAEAVARTFIRFPPLEAYRLDITGSVLGIAGFTALSFLGAPPVAWGAVSGFLMLALVQRGWRLLHVAAAIGLVLMLGRESLVPFYSWSPYYKVAVAEVPGANDVHDIAVNGIPHQTIASVAQRRADAPIYFVPYERVATGTPEHLLIVGAGTGSDVAVALEQGVARVDAVEIDPRLHQLGVELNPDRPYEDDRVTMHVDDGRAYLERSPDRYDLVIFALPDSLTLVAGQSSLRLESYLFTVQAMETARAHLADGGVFAMYNYYRESWLIDRLAGTLARVYGHPPCVDTVGEVGGLAALTIGLEADDVTCPSLWTAAGIVPAPTTDDYPFLYLRIPSIPDFYLLTIVLILVASVAFVRLASGPFRPMLRYGDLFFMGAAFLLLETKSVVQFALLFGTTWVVNSVVFGGILLSVLAAIEMARRHALPRPLVLYAFLLASVVASLVVPPAMLLQLPALPRLLAAVLVYFTPIFIANLVFAQRFRNVEAAGIAFGANLLGAMLGGVLEYTALVSGYQLLAVLVALFYAAAFFFGRRQLRQAA